MGAEAAEIRLRLRSVPSNPAKDYLAGFLGKRQKNNAAKASLANLQQRYRARVKKYMRNHRMNDANLRRAQLQAMIRIGDMLEKIVGALMSAVSGSIGEPPNGADAEAPRITLRAS